MLTKSEFENMRKEIELALASVAKKYNCEVHAGNIKYSNVTATISVEFNSKGAEGMSAEQNLFNTYCAQFGFSPLDYRCKIEIGNKIYSLVGFNLKARKNFFIIEREGKTYACAREAFKLK